MRGRRFANPFSSRQDAAYRSEHNRRRIHSEAQNSNSLRIYSLPRHAFRQESRNKRPVGYVAFLSLSLRDSKVKRRERICKTTSGTPSEECVNCVARLYIFIWKRRLFMVKTIHIPFRVRINKLPAHTVVAKQKRPLWLQWISWSMNGICMRSTVFNNTYIYPNADVNKVVNGDAPHHTPLIICFPVNAKLFYWREP